MPESKKDCFAYVSENNLKGCFALNELYCKKEDCRFYQEKMTAKQKYLDSYNIETAQTVAKNIDKYFRQIS